MFADDIVLFTIDKESLKAQLNSLDDCSLQSGLTINVKKTKI